MKLGPRDTAPGERLDVLLLLAVVVVTAASAPSTAILASDPTTVTAVIRLTIDRGDYAEAERRARSLLEGRDSSARGGTLEAARALDLLVESLQRQEFGYSADVREMAERALEIKRRHLPPDHPDLAPTLANLARVRFQVDLDLPAALAVSDEALRIAEGALEPNDPRQARYWTGRAEVLLEMGNIDGTRKALENAFRLLRPDSPPTSWADAMYVQGKLEFVASDFKTAVARFEDAVERTEATFGKDHPETARMLSQLALSLTYLDRYEDADKAADRCVGIDTIHYGRVHPRVGFCIRVRGRVAIHSGALSHSRQLYEEALEIIESTCGPGHPGLMGLLNEYGWLLYESWDLQPGRTALERAIDIAERYLGASDHRIGWLLNSYGNLLSRMGDDAGAERAFERGIRLGEDSAERNLLQWSTAVINLAHLKQVGGDLEAARRLYAEALPAFENTPAVGAIWRSEVKQIYGGLLWRMGEETEARRLLDEALEIRRRALGERHHFIGTLLNTYALGLERSGDIAGAYERRRRALEILEAKLGPDSPKVGLQLRSIAHNRLRAGQPAEAFATAARAERIRTIGLRLTTSALSERHALAYADGWPSAQSLLLTLAIEGDGEADPSTAWDVVTGSRALVVDELAARHRSLSEAGVPPELVAELVAARERLASLVVRGAGDGYAARFDETLKARERAEERVAAISKDFRRRRGEAGIGLAEVKAALPRGAALVAFVGYTHLRPRPSTNTDGGGALSPFDEVPSYAAFVLSPTTRAVTIVPLGPADRIDAAVAAWLAEASSPPEPIRVLAAESVDRYRHVGEVLRERVWDPVAETVAGATRVFVVPDAALNAVSFASLPARTGGHLVEDGPEFHYLSAERDLAAQVPRPRNDRLLLVGGPDFDAATAAPDLATVADDGALRASLETRPDAARFRGERPGCDDFRDLRFRMLAGAASEVDQVSALWNARRADRSEGGSPSVQRLTGPRAHEAWFKTLAPDFGTLHLATHGFFLGDDCVPGAGSPTDLLLLSGLALAGANNRAETGSEEEDGILTAEEVASLDLSAADWVVLSGCETGRGRAVSGEGVFGLRRAFRVAGAGTLIMSLWRVDDDATRRWMRALYRARRDGGSTPEAVREAMAHVLEENRQLGLPDHPFYWGAFVAAGDWR